MEAKQDDFKMLPVDFCNDVDFENYYLKQITSKVANSSFLKKVIRKSQTNEACPMKERSKPWLQQDTYYTLKYHEVNLFQVAQI